MLAVCTGLLILSDDSSGDLADSSCALSFYANGGMGQIQTQHILAGNSVDLPSSGLKRNGYYLSGWTTDSTEGAHLDLGATLMVTSDTAFYAEWTSAPSNLDTEAPALITVGTAYHYKPYSTYDDLAEGSAWTHFAVYLATSGNDGTRIVSDSLPSWMSITINGHSVTLGGICSTPGVYEFQLHLIRLIIGTGYSEIDGTRVSMIVTVAPEHEGMTHSVSFDGNGGSGIIDSKTAIHGNAVLLPSDGMTKSGYTLSGWKISVDGTEATFPLGSVYTVRGDVIVKAYWVADSNIVVLDANGGTATVNTTFIARTDGPITLPAEGYEKTGYALSGWYLPSDPMTIYAKGHLFNISGSLTFKAYWVTSGASLVTASFANGGGTGTLAQSVEIGKNVVMPTYGFDKTGCKLIGWTAGPSSYRCGDAVVLSGDTIFMAEWTVSTTTASVSFDLNGGLGSIPTQIVKPGDVVTAPSEPTRDGHIFTEWKIIGGGIWDFDTKVKYSITLQAQWTEHFIATTDGCTVTISIGSVWTQFGTVVEWGDGTSSAGYGTIYIHEYQYGTTGHLTVSSVNGNAVAGVSSMIYAILEPENAQGSEPVTDWTWVIIATIAALLIVIWRFIL